jgi:hypothetical protein
MELLHLQEVALLSNKKTYVFILFDLLQIVMKRIMMNRAEVNANLINQSDSIKSPLR